ncbi:hypothetical protein [Tautonia plasticadhaerens]|uniref:hypothetical protein n=1 Tax=Tautonia plasticadhaerens TaxID=2527974 RepID=UPI0011A1F89D|nr:hypothetical protein [Tautonia plasticadhaerens]
MLALSLIAGRPEPSHPGPDSAGPGSVPGSPGASAPPARRFALADEEYRRLRESVEPEPVGDGIEGEEARSAALSAEVDALLRRHPGLDSGRLPGASAALGATVRRSRALGARLSALDAAILEAQSEEIRARGLGEYVVFEDRSQRIEERDVLHRLELLLGGDRDQAGRELARSHRINGGSASSVGAEQLQRQEERALVYRARLESLGAQRDAVDGLAPASAAGLRAARSLASYHGRRRAMLGRRREALGADREASRAWARAHSHRLGAALTAVVLGEHPDTGAEADWPGSCPGLREDSARILLRFRLDPGEDRPVGGPDRDCPGPASAYRREAEEALRWEAKAAQAELEAAREALAADLAALDFEADALEAALLYDSYIVGRIGAAIARLDAQAELTDAQLRYAGLRLGRAELLASQKAAGVQVAERAERLAEHYEHASQRSWSDQAALRRLLVAMESVGEADRAVLPVLAGYREAVEASLALASTIVEASPLGRWRPEGPDPKDGNTTAARPGLAAEVSAAEEAVRAARLRLDRLVDDLLSPFDTPRARLSDRLSTALGPVDPADLGRVVPLRTLRRHSSNDPGPIQARGPEDILRTALEPRGAELREWRRMASDLAGE